MKTSEFAGFSPETFDFLWGIRLNNHKEWFAAHKKDYVDRLYEPMKALGQAAFRPFLNRPGNLLKVSRIYRDARMHYPVPYKESLWLCIRQDVEWWAENPCLYFEIRPEGASAGFLFWKPKTACGRWNFTAGRRWSTLRLRRRAASRRRRSGTPATGSPSTNGRPVTP